MRETFDLRGDQASPKRDNKEVFGHAGFFTKVRIYVPLDHTYTYFYLLKIDENVTGEVALLQVLNQMKLPFNLVAKSTASDTAMVIDPTEY